LDCKGLSSPLASGASICGDFFSGDFLGGDDDDDGEDEEADLISTSSERE